MPNLEIDAAAQTDLDDIFSDGAIRFGLAQAESYRAKILDAFKLIQDSPFLGRAARGKLDDLRILARPFPCRIVYRVMSNRLVVLRVIHGKQDIHRAIDDL